MAHECGKICSFGEWWVRVWVRGVSPIACPDGQLPACNVTLSCRGAHMPAPVQQAMPNCASALAPAFLLGCSH